MMFKITSADDTGVTIDWPGFWAMQRGVDDGSGQVPPYFCLPNSLLVSGMTNTQLATILRLAALFATADYEGASELRLSLGQARLITGEATDAEALDVLQAASRG